MNWKKPIMVLGTAVYIGVACTALYHVFIGRYVVMPYRDRQFLKTNPTEAEILLRFGTPEETIAAGEQFVPTGWHPTPDNKASYIGYCFMRNVEKYYIFISTNKVLESYTIGRS